MSSNNKKEVWFLVGSQHLYGQETLDQVAVHAQEIVSNLNKASGLAAKIEYKPVLKTTDEITSMIVEANYSKSCIGIIVWMHTFSPSKMWLRGIKQLQKPMLHLHTQFNRDIPWSTIDMDFMNLNQSAHGDREFGFMLTRFNVVRKVVVGHWQEETVQSSIADWIRVCIGVRTFQELNVVRFGDNMRQVAVTEGNKVSAEWTFGTSINTHGVGDLVKHIDAVSEDEISSLIQEYNDTYSLQDSLKNGGSQFESLKESARIEAGLRSFLQKGGYGAYTNTFEDLHGMKQLPGLASQRLMAEGYGFGAEGDWKTSALLRVMKTMAEGLEGGNSFMEDYTYHFHPTQPMVLGAHMLEICPSIADGKPKCEIHPLGIGGKEDPVRLVFNAVGGPALNVSLIDLGNRFRFLVNTVNGVQVDQDIPNLPVARALWEPMPDMRTACEAWLLAGGAHHTVYSQNISVGQIQNLAEIFGVECVVIDENTTIQGLKKEMQANELYYK